MAIINSLPKYNLTGAVHQFVRVPNDSANIYFLGTCEVQPDIRVRPMSLEVKNDRRGRLLPAQKTNQGQMADIGLQMSYYSELALFRVLNLQTDATTFASNGIQVIQGWTGRFGIGSLVFGSKTFELWNVFERQTSATYRDTNQPVGFYWPQVEVVSHAPITLGNQEKQYLLVLEAQEKMLPQALYSAVDDGAFERSFMLFRACYPNDADLLTYFPAEVFVPQ